MKVKLLLILPLAMLFFGVTRVLAQETTAAQSEADYRFQFDGYRTAYQTYQVDKSEYLRTGTLKAEQEALESGKLAAIARVKTLAAYTQWMRLQLLQYANQYSRAAELASRLDQQNVWFLSHQTEISAATSKTVFEAVMEKYTDDLEQREKLYMLAQIELKLARLTSFRLEIIRLADPLRVVLAQADSPEITQGLSRADENLIALETRINTESEMSKVLEGMKIAGRRDDPQDAGRNSTREIESLRQLTLSTINILAELEGRYGQ